VATHLYGMQRQLVERAIDGDFDAFSDLVTASTSRQYAIATLILRDRDRAHDAVQEALVAAWRGLGALREPAAWEAWLTRLTVRACYAAAKKDRRRSLVELAAKPEFDVASDIDEPAALAERDRVQRELGALPIDQRAVIVLHFYVGLPLTEAAVVLGVPAGTAKSRLHRALQALRLTITPDRVPQTQLPQERPA
jgi:RNA polymerase sigma-70 factor, ECF subfamily